MLHVAAVFTIACAILTGNAVLSFWPYMSKGFQPPTAVLYVEGILGVLSSALFLIGGVFSFIDTLKANRGERLKNEAIRDYGTVIIEDETPEETEKPLEKSRRESIRIAVTEVLERTTSLARTISLNTVHEESARIEDASWWELFPTANGLRVPELRFLASLISLSSSFIYTVTAVRQIQGQSGDDCSSRHEQLHVSDTAVLSALHLSTCLGDHADPLTLSSRYYP